MANEKRLIDANALIERCKEIAGYEWNHKASPVCWADAYEQFADDVEAEPTVDTVEVVRCKDCVHMKIQFSARFCNVWCMYNGLGDEGFCNYGEREDK